MRRCFVCHYHEISLKKKNRRFFERKLVANIRQALHDLPYRAVRPWNARIVVHLTPDSPVEEVRRRLGKVFGIAAFAAAWRVPAPIEDLKRHVESLIEQRDFLTFRISCKRADKRYPMTTPEIERELGAHVCETFGKKVRLEDPDLNCQVQILGAEALVHFERLKGPGGLPVSSAGKIVALISGGIDSPVSAYKVMKRGCRPVFVHFHSHPHTSLDAQDKVKQLVALLCDCQPAVHLYMVPFAPAQRRIVASTPAPTRVILYRRMMMRIGARIASRERAKALVTGDSIGQVSSQTLDNLRAVTEASPLPVLRPLIGDDKEEIIQQARRIGTFGISIGADDDCCSLFLPRHPETRARLRQVEQAESSLDIDGLVQEALETCERHRVDDHFKQKYIGAERLHADT